VYIDVVPELIVVRSSIVAQVAVVGENEAPRAVASDTLK